MKKLTIILVTLLMVATGCLCAQNHRHTDRSNEAAVESIANIAISDTTEVEEVFGEFIGNDGAIVRQLDQNMDEAASIAKVAIIAVFGGLALIIIVPILVIALIIYLIVRNNNKNKGNANGPVNAIPADKTYDTSEKSTESSVASTPQKEKTKMERGLKKVAIGVGFVLFGMWCNATPFTAVGFGILIYGAGLICIDIFVDKK